MKTRKVVLHVGPDKTGTTTIQRACFRGRESLRSQSVFYPVIDGREASASDDCPGAPFTIDREINHRLLVSGFDGANSKLPVNIGIPREDRNRRDAFYRNRLSLALEKNIDSDILLSHEGVHSLTRSELAGLRDYLAAFGDETALIYFVRHPLSYATSAISQRVRSGLPAGGNPLPYVDHRVVLERYASVFGKEAIHVERYTGDMVETFRACLSEVLGRSIALPSPEQRSNPGLSDLAIEVGRLIIGRWDLERGALLKQPWYGKILESIPGNRFRLAEGEAASLKANTAESSAYLRNEFGIDFEWETVESSGSD